VLCLQVRATQHCDRTTPSSSKRTHSPPASHPAPAHCPPVRYLSDFHLWRQHSPRAAPIACKEESLPTGKYTAWLALRSCPNTNREEGVRWPSAGPTQAGGGWKPSTFTPSHSHSLLPGQPPAWPCPPRPFALESWAMTAGLLSWLLWFLHWLLLASGMPTVAAERNDTTSASTTAMWVPWWASPHTLCLTCSANKMVWRPQRGSLWASGPTPVLFRGHMLRAPHQCWSSQFQRP
jgi:hypothetical protein